MDPINPEFFRIDAVEAAKELIGCKIIFGRCSGIIMETEAYKGGPASHAHTKTSRSSIMFDTFGMVYVYLIYGMYHCLNITTNPPGDPGAVLIRTVKPISGLELMKKRRKTEKPESLCSGPGKLCMAFGITCRETEDPVGKNIVLYRKTDEYPVRCAKRIGIKKDIERLWRFIGV